MANVKFNLEADEAKAVQAFLRVVDAQHKTEKSFRNTTAAAKIQDKVFGDISHNVKSFVGAFAGLAGVKAALSSMNEEAKRSAEIIKASERARSQNITLAEGSIYKKALIESQEKAFAITAGVSPEEAAKSVFNIRSLFPSESDKAEAVKFMARSSDFVRDPAKFAEGIGTVKNAMGDEAGSVRQIGNKLLVAANASKTDPSEFGNEFSKIAKIGSGIKAKDEFLMSALSLGSAGQASAAEAATRIRSLMVEMVKNDVIGDGLEGKFKTLLNKGITKENVLKKFTGSTEAAEGFAMLSDDFTRIQALRDTLLQEQSLAGTPNSALNKTIRLRDQDASLALSKMKRSSDQEIDQASQRFGVEELANTNAWMAAIKDRSTRPHYGQFDKKSMQYIGETLTEYAPFLGPENIGKITSFMGKDVSEVFDGFSEKLISTLEKIEQHLENNNKLEAVRAAPKMSRNNGFVE